jgi:hypothetical protein
MLFKILWAIGLLSVFAWQWSLNRRALSEDGAPLPVRIVWWLNVVLFMTYIGVAVSSQWWAPQSSSPSHPYGVRFRGGDTYFYPTALGWFMDKYFFWIFIGLGVVMGLMKAGHDAVVRRSSASGRGRGAA